MLLFGVLQHAIGKHLLKYLPVVDLLLDRAGSQQAVDAHLPAEGEVKQETCGPA